MCFIILNAVSALCDLSLYGCSLSRIATNDESILKVYVFNNKLWASSWFDFMIFFFVSNFKFCFNNGLTHLLKHFTYEINVWTYFIYLIKSANLYSMLNQAMLKHVQCLNEERRILLLLIVCIIFLYVLDIMIYKNMINCAIRMFCNE